jgi:trk system potassium uptake protein TrkA
MRIAFIGAGSLAVVTAQILIRRGHDVVIVERNKDCIETLSHELDCGLIHGDGTRPDILRELDPAATDVLFCLTGNDQANIIASLVGRSLGFKRVITKIEDREFEHVGMELGLQDIIVPARTIGRFLADTIKGQDILELSSLIKGEARMLSFVVHDAEEGPLSALELPAETHVVCIYRNSEFFLPETDAKLKKDDEVVLITHRKHIEALRDKLINHIEKETV